MVGIVVREMTGGSIDWDDHHLDDHQTVTGEFYRTVQIRVNIQERMSDKRRVHRPGLVTLHQFFFLHPIIYYFQEY